MPDAAITTDIIVGFPGETESDFAATLEVVTAARFAGAFTFQYSIRPGTPAATMPDQVPKPVVQERYDRLAALVNEVALHENQRQVGRRVEVLFATGEGRKDAVTARISGRARDNRLVHVAVPEDPARRPRPGDIADVVITYAAPHHLNADAGVLDLRRTAGGDAWAASQSSPDRRPPVTLGVPTVGLPPPLSAASCTH
jgi:tRNA-2-methylthio-N6-dimethylallyladenosine synthase